MWYHVWVIQRIKREGRPIEEAKQVEYVGADNITEEGEFCLFPVAIDQNLNRLKSKYLEVVERLKRVDERPAFFGSLVDQWNVEDPLLHALTTSFLCEYFLDDLSLLFPDVD